MVGEQVRRDSSPPPPAARRNLSRDVVHALEDCISRVKLATADSKDGLDKVDQDIEEISGDMAKLVIGC